MSNTIIMKEASPLDIFAAGADLKNTFCFVKQNQLICSEQNGDLEDAAVYHHYIESIKQLQRLYKVEPKVVVCDLHPGYLSTQYAQTWHGLQARPATARRFAETSEDTARMAVPHIKTIQVQHHWAHIASVLFEHGEPASPAKRGEQGPARLPRVYGGQVIGLACDGTGYGTDGAIWGCECLLASLEKFERFGHLAYYQLAGADKASKEAIRPVLGLLKKTYGEGFELDKFKWLLDKIEPDKNKQQIILEQIDKRLNTVETSSLGRVFDAVAAMVGLGSINNTDAQLPIALESIAEGGVEEYYDFELIEKTDEPVQLDLCKMIEQLIADIQAKKDTGVISAKFHNTLANGLLAMAKQAREYTKLDTVALTGGVFCNRYLTNRLIKLLKESDFNVLFNKDVPTSDGGVAVGQAAIASYLVARGL